MDNVTLIRVVAGIAAVLVLFIIVWRRKRKSVD
ncbi:MAG: LPXTG cell wall anchor domain-containing protein [Candidatus Acidiferrales bacterium]